MFHSVIIASLNRREALGETLAHFDGQTVPPDQVIVSVVKPEDLPADLHNAVVVTGPMGSAVQRNTGLAALDPRCDVISFFDDDVELAPDYCQRMRAAFERDPELLALDGITLADGTGIGGITREQARAQLSQPVTHEQATPLVTPRPSLYGCNMNVRRRVMEQFRFDEKFAAYGWLEDLDFSNRVATAGKLGCATDCRLVHLAITKGRTSGLRMGVSQIINPLYMWRKGSFGSLPRLLRRYWLPVLFTNSIGAITGWRSTHVDRRGRFKGNLLGLWHVLRGRIDPEMVLKHR